MNGGNGTAGNGAALKADFNNSSLSSPASLCAHRAYGSLPVLSCTHAPDAPDVPLPLAAGRGVLGAGGEWGGWAAVSPWLPRPEPADSGARRRAPSLRDRGWIELIFTYFPRRGLHTPVRCHYYQASYCYSADEGCPARSFGSRGVRVRGVQHLPLGFGLP